MHTMTSSIPRNADYPGRRQSSSSPNHHHDHALATLKSRAGQSEFGQTCYQLSVPGKLFRLCRVVRAGQRSPLLPIPWVPSPDMSLGTGTPGFPPPSGDPLDTETEVARSPIASPNCCRKVSPPCSYRFIDIDIASSAQLNLQYGKGPSSYNGRSKRRLYCDDLTCG